MSKVARMRAVWSAHLVAFAAAQIIFAVTDNSWAVSFLRGTLPDDEPILMIASRIWLIVFTIDTIWTWWSIADRKRKAKTEPAGTHHPLVTRHDDQ